MPVHCKGPAKLLSILRRPPAAVLRVYGKAARPSHGPHGPRKPEGAMPSLCKLPGVKETPQIQQIQQQKEEQQAAQAAHVQAVPFKCSPAGGPCRHLGWPMQQLTESIGEDALGALLFVRGYCEKQCLEKCERKFHLFEALCGAFLIFTEPAVIFTF